MFLGFGGSVFFDLGGTFRKKKVGWKVSSVKDGFGWFFSGLSRRVSMSDLSC